MTDLDALAWPAERLHVGLPLLARRAGLAPREVELTPLGGDASGAAADEALSGWLASASELLGVECEPVRPRLQELEAFGRRAAPAVVALPGGGPPRYLLVLSSSRRAMRVLAPDLSLHRVPVDRVTTLLADPVCGPREAMLAKLLDEIGLRGRARARAGAALVREHLGAARLQTSWLVRVPPGRSLLLQVRRSGLLARMALVVVAHAAHVALFLAAWYTIGRGALQGGFELGWIQAWALLLLMLVPLRFLESWSQEVFGVGVGALLKRRLLAGALRQTPDEVRHQGAGQLLGRVLESEAVEVLALSAAFQGLGAAVELALAAWVLHAGAGGLPHVALLATWCGLTLLFAVRHHRRALADLESRLEVSCDLVERIVGHGTRRAQQASEHWHDVEDGLLERYLGNATRLDRSTVLASGFVPASWLVAALVGLAPAFVGGASVTSLAVAVGGCLLAQQALGRLAGGSLQAASLAVAWRKVAPLFHAAARPEAAGVPELAASARVRPAGGDRPPPRGAAARLEVRDLTYRYPERHASALRDCSLTVEEGDRVLVTGSSGGGKSTLVSQLTGLRSPTSGRVTLDGLDRDSWGAGAWRKRVACAPQYHENFVFSGPLAYNLLLGRSWPAEDHELAEAEAVCRELGLGELLDRMPAGIRQTVGETGWQLSHGERSRVFLARALLQGADVVILDESFAALDAANLRRSLACVGARAPASVVIAHP